MQGNVLGQVGGSSKINGIIEEYKVASGGNVNAGDFVRFVDDTYSENVQLSNDNYSGNKTDMILLDENRVFILYVKTSSQYLYGAICTILNNNISVGTEVKLSTTNIDCLTAILLDENKAFITYTTGSYVYGMICTALQDTITIGTKTNLGSASSAINSLSATKYRENKVCIIYSGYNPNNTATMYLYNTICTVAENSIIVENNVRFPSTYSSEVNELSTIALDESTIFVMIGYRQLYGIICTIEENTITVGIKTEMDILSNEYISNIFFSKKIKENKIFIFYGHNSNTSATQFLYGMLCKIENEMITTGERTDLETRYNHTNSISTVLLNGNNMLAVGSGRYEGYSDIHLYKTLYKISEMNIIPEEEKRINSSLNRSEQTKIELLNKNTIFIITGNGSPNEKDNSLLYGIIGNINMINKTDRIQDNIIGIAKTKGTAGQTIKVVVPN